MDVLYLVLVSSCHLSFSSEIRYVVATTFILEHPCLLFILEKLGLLNHFNFKDVFLISDELV